ncbi:MAG: S1 RNA-binding domain-containing protein [Mycoplasmataceae bacterium]|nr:S1 RNA-binding domain-containing protein [Mycoplasmataceae bacterium]
MAHNDLQVGKIYKCEVIKIKPSFVILKVSNNVNGICHISETSDYHIKDISNVFTIGNIYNFLLIKKTDDNKYIFSYKKLIPKLLKYRKNIIPTPSGFKNLIEKLYIELKKSTFSSIG